MLFALALFCFLLVHVSANECKCYTKGKDTSCRIPMQRIIQESGKNLKWTRRMYDRAKQEADNTLTRTPGYVAAFFYNDFKPTDGKPMDQKVNMTMDRGKLSSRMELVREGARFGCYCEYEVGPANNDMMIYCFFR